MAAAVARVVAGDDDDLDAGARGGAMASAMPARSGSAKPTSAADVPGPRRRPPRDARRARSPAAARLDSGVPRARLTRPARRHQGARTASGAPMASVSTTPSAAAGVRVRPASSTGSVDDESAGSRLRDRPGRLDRTSEGRGERARRDRPRRGPRRRPRPAAPPRGRRAGRRPSRPSSVADRGHVQPVPGQGARLVGDDQVDRAEGLLGVEAPDEDAAPSSRYAPSPRMTASRIGGSSGIAAIAAEMPARRFSPSACRARTRARW